MTQTRSTDNLGTKKALWYRYRYLAGYLILLAAVIFSMARVQQISTEGRDSLAASARTVVIEGCRRDNETRGTLRAIIAHSDKQLKVYLKDGLINKKQYKIAKKQSKDAQKLLHDINCKKASEKIKTN